MIIIELPLHIITHHIDKTINDKTAINLSLSSKNMYNELRNSLNIRKAKKNGERYMKMIYFYEKCFKMSFVELFESLSCAEWNVNMLEWYSLLQNDDVLFENKFWVDSIYNYCILINKNTNKCYTNKYCTRYWLDIKMKNNDCSIMIKTPTLVLIPPRTDIIIDYN